MLNKLLRKDLFYFFNAIFLVSLPFGKSPSTYCIYPVIVFALLNFETKKFKWHAVLFPLFLISVFIIDVINNTISFTLWEKYISLFIFPLLLWQLDRRQLRKLFLFFAYAVSFSMFLNLLIALISSISYESGQFIFNASLSDRSDNFFGSILYGGNQFYGSHFSSFLHPTYAAIYCISALIILIQINSQRKLYFWLQTPSIVILVLSIYLLSSKAGIFILILLLLYLLISKIKQKPKNIVLWISVLTLFFIVFFLSMSNPRIKVLLSDIENLKFNKSSQYSNQTRLMTWHASYELIMDKPFGVGLTETQNYLNNYYNKFKYVTPLKRTYNSHNQYFTFGISGGLFMLIFFISILLLYLKWNWFGNDDISLILKLIYLTFYINFVFETVLGRYEGIILFSYFLSLRPSD